MVPISAPPPGGVFSGLTGTGTSRVLARVATWTEALSALHDLPAMVVYNRSKFRARPRVVLPNIFKTTPANTDSEIIVHNCAIISSALPFSVQNSFS